ncbi:MAG: winged helix-turn-helix domain-containing protein [Devosia sp.]|uniref:winged helix-turn-helix domain-containing protein n=1 Tax=Devosia sp. 66-22 TaxID=1895753 RepID=UPI000927523D|nr:winged helix-turn-helix domain-containing protein [Devosia sp. 66-22]MBN9348067.1 winged helix-turn-helix domain-containing protein [Devosia sp.]OJX46523.1 MAG: hypothetical protein BGO81_03965 [Devosia sp. 66-22]
MSPTDDNKFHISLRVIFDDQFYLGPGRADLLELIASTGSIAAASQKMGMSYKRAWEIVRALNTGFGSALVSSSRGGKTKGGAVLTNHGQMVLASYRSMQEKAAAAIKENVATVRAALNR